MYAISDNLYIDDTTKTGYSANTYGVLLRANGYIKNNFCNIDYKYTQEQRQNGLNLDNYSKTNKEVWAKLYIFLIYIDDN